MVLGAQTQRILNFFRGRRFALQTKEMVELLAGKRDLQAKRIFAVLESWCAQDKGAIVAVNFREDETLQAAIVVGALVEEGLNQTKRRVVIQVINQLDITLQLVGNFRVE